jgi:hypothetical protein
VLQLAIRQVQKAASFQDASGDLREMLGVPVCPSHLRKISQRIGGEWLALRQAEVRAFRDDSLASARPEAPRPFLRWGACCTIQARAAPAAHPYFSEAQMGKKLYVGNLSFNVDSSGLQRMFEPYGTVQSAQVVMDRDSGRSKGFGFVEMGSEQEAQAAIEALAGRQVGGRSLTVNEAKPREDRGGGGRGGYGGGGGRGGYGGGGGRGGRY